MSASPGFKLLGCSSMFASVTGDWRVVPSREHRALSRTRVLTPEADITPCPLLCPFKLLHLCMNTMQSDFCCTPHIHRDV